MKLVDKVRKYLTEFNWVISPAPAYEREAIEAVARLRISSGMVRIEGWVCVAPVLINTRDHQGCGHGCAC